MRRIVVSFGAVLLVLFLTSPAQAGKPAAGSKNVVHSFSTSTASWPENTGGPFVLTISRTGNVKCPSTVHWSTADGTATSTDDYFSASGTVAFAKNQTAGGIPITLKSDAASESNESFTVTLDTPATTCKGGAAATIGSTSTVTVTVTDGDFALTVPDGQTATITSMRLLGCDSEVDADLLTSNGDEVQLGHDDATSGCSQVFNPDAQEWTNTTGGPVTIRIALHDETCSRTYYSDTTSHDDTLDVDLPYSHAVVVPDLDHPGNYSFDLDAAAFQCVNADAHTSTSTGNGQFGGHLRIWEKPPVSDGVVTLGPGQQASVEWALNACNEVGLYRVIDGTPSFVNGNAYGQCSGSGEFTIGNPADASSDIHLVLRLVDVTCDNSEYNSDSTGAADHAIARGDDPMYVDIRDAAGDCSLKTSAAVPTVTGTGNLTATVDIGPVP